MPDNISTPEKRARRTAYATKYRQNHRKRVRAASLRYYRANRAKEALRYQRRYSKPEYRLRTRKRINDRKEAKLVSLAGRPRPEYCEVCGRPGIINFDHCHRRNIFRGWLCQLCNAILGFAEDDPNILRQLAAYLDRTKTLVPPQLSLPGI